MLQKYQPWGQPSGGAPKVSVLRAYYEHPLHVHRLAMMVRRTREDTGWNGNQLYKQIKTLTKITTNL